MDIFILLATMLICFLIGMPIAYSLALAAIAGALVDRNSAGSGDAEDLRRRQQGGDADDPVLRAGRRDHGRRRHGAPAGRVCRRAGRIYPGARRPLDRQRAGDDVPQRHFRLGGGRYLRDRLGDDPADGKGRLSPRVRDQPHHHRLGSGAAGAAEPQRGAVFAGDRRHDLDQRAVHGRRVSRAAARLLADHPLSRHRLSRQASARPDRAGEGRASRSPSTQPGGW